MRKYLVRRVLQALPILLGITLISFFIIHLAPGDPLAMDIEGTKISPEAIQIRREQMNLDKPIPVQYWIWVKGLVRGDFGWSFQDGRPIVEHLKERIPITLLIMGIPMLIAVLVSIPLGIISATRQYSLADQCATVFAFLGISIPNFWFGIVLMMIFSLWLGWLPATGLKTIGAPFSIADRAKYLIMPTIVLATGQMASLVRYVRSSMLEVIRQDYVRTARAKGVSERLVIYKHALKNAMIPVVTILALMMPGLLGGALMTENVFALPGMGRWTVRAVFYRDYPAVMASLTVSSVMIVAFNLIADILYGFLDPRIKYD
ncbi:MAG: ABC transporter permease [Bacillota bacterium]